MARYVLDRIDVEILDQLRADGRVPFTSVAQAVGLSPDAVRARYARLVGDGIVRVIGLVHPKSLGYNRRASVWLSYHGNTDALAKQVRGLPNIAFMTETLSAWNVLVEVVGRDDAEVADIVTAAFRSLPEVRSVELSSMLEVVKWQTQAKQGSTAAPAPAADLEETETALLRLLIDNPRANYRDLAAHLGEPYWWVRKRTQALFAEGVISVAVMVDRLSTEPALIASFELRLNGPEAVAALRAISKMDEVALLTVNSGCVDASGELTCTDDSHMAQLSLAIRALPGVADARIRPYVRTLILPMPWSIDPDPMWR